MALSVIEQRDKEDDTDEEMNSSAGTPKGRKKIRKIIEDVNLRAETQEALREEEERCKRLADREQQMEDRREVLQPKVTAKLQYKVLVLRVLVFFIMGKKDNSK